jgi:hypothetical protein
MCVHIPNLKKKPTYCDDKLVRVNNSYTERLASHTRIWRGEGRKKKERKRGKKGKSDEAIYTVFSGR